MTGSHPQFEAWGRLAPAEAAAELQRRILRRLAPPQRRAAIASLRTPDALVDLFERAAGPLRGVPYFLKDLFPVAGEAMLAGSTFLPEVRPPASEDSRLVAVLRRAGAVLAGRAHLHEFAYGITGENPHYGDCELPRFPGRTTGGSSSGSAALVAAGIVPLAVGSDTGGSVRLPAAFCGLFGIRFSPGEPWISDAFPLSRRFDTAGWFTARASDLLQTLAALGVSSGPARSGTPRGIYLPMPGLDFEVGQACREAVRHLQPKEDAAAASALGEAFRLALECYNTIAGEEAWSVHKAWVGPYRHRYDPNVLARLERFHSITKEDRDRAIAAFQEIRRAWSRYFETHDFVALAASPFPALLKADCTPASRQRILTLTAPASVGGLPVVSIPVRLPSGLTTGLQIVVANAESPVIPWALGRFEAQGAAALSETPG